MIQIANARKQFGSVTAVDGVSFVAQDGAITGLLGPNGAGKTTTLRMLYAVMKPDSGEVRVDDVDAVATPQAAQARLGVLPDGFGLYPRLTAREHLDYFGALQGIESDRLAKRTEELLDLLDMRAIADRRTAGFSHGERTKVALARALVHDPQNVLLDEPTNGLDVMSTRAVRAIVRRLRDQGRCVLFSSHVMQEVSALCDSIVVIAPGRVVAQGTPDELRRADRPSESRGCVRRARRPRRGVTSERDADPLRQTLIVCRKELRDSLRDRRALWSILFSVVIGPVLIGFMMNKLADRQRDADVVRIPVVGMHRAPALVDWLNQQSGVHVVEGPAEAEAGRARAARGCRRDRARRLRRAVPRVATRAAATRRRQLAQRRAPIGAARAILLQQYAAEISSLRLIVRGVSPAAVRPLAIEEIEVSTAQQRAAQILTFIPMFIMVAGFVGGMQIATDSTAGERERGSLEPLLVNPAPRVAFVAGKWMAATLAAIVSVCLTTLLCAQLTRLLTLEDMGIRLEIGPQHVGPILLGRRADVSVHRGTAGRRRHACAIVQGSADLHGRPDPRADAARRHVRALSDRQRGMDLRRPDARAYILLTDVLGGRVPGRRRRFSLRQGPASRQRDPDSDHDRTFSRANTSSFGR